MRFIFLFIISLPVYSFETCGDYKVVGEVSCSKKHCVLVTNKGALSEKYSLLSNMNPKDYQGMSFYLAGNLQVDKVLNYRQVIGEISELRLIDQRIYERINSPALQVLEKSCEP